MENLNEQIQAILERNRRVEADKAWEVSWTRRSIITVSTYITVVLLLLLTESVQPWFGAAIPACAYLLSTCSLPWLRKLWMRRYTPERNS